MNMTAIHSPEVEPNRRAYVCNGWEADTPSSQRLSPSSCSRTKPSCQYPAGQHDFIDRQWSIEAVEVDSLSEMRRDEENRTAKRCPNRCDDAAQCKGAGHVTRL